MISRDYRDMAGGMLLFAGGLAYSCYALTNYGIGTLRNLGPGTFPAALGFILAFFGLIISVRAWFATGRPIERDLRSPLMVLAGVAAFALLVRPFGMIPAIISVMVVSSFADTQFRPASLAMLCAVVSALMWLIFKVGLGVPIPMFHSPF